MYKFKSAKKATATINGSLWHSKWNDLSYFDRSIPGGDRGCRRRNKAEDQTLCTSHPGSSWRRNHGEEARFIQRAAVVRRRGNGNPDSGERRGERVSLLRRSALFTHWTAAGPTEGDPPPFPPPSTPSTPSMTPPPPPIRGQSSTSALMDFNYGRWTRSILKAVLTRKEKKRFVAIYKPFK